MKHKPLIILAAILILLLFMALITLAQENEPVTESDNAQQAEPGAVLANLGTAFTYQGRLVDDSNPANGIYDFQFRLYDSNDINSHHIGGVVVVDDVNVSGGLFTVGLDFGAGLFDGQARWLGISVKRDADITYTGLSRVALTPAPYALALPGLWTQQNATSPNLIGGYAGNVMGDGVTGGAIAGGGESGLPNRIYDRYGTVGGGRSNVAGVDDGNSFNQDFATIGGGSGNSASSPFATVGGGGQNTASGLGAVVGGGQTNTASGSGATISGGADNLASAKYATVAGGGPSTPNDPTTSNRVYDEYGTISGGGNNVVGVDDGISNNQNGATVAGGGANTASGVVATVGGGSWNTASGVWAMVGGGYNNEASAQYATVPGGQDALASQYNQLAYASGRFADNGDAQISLYVLRQETADATLTELFLDGSSERITLAADRVLTFDILVVGNHRFGGSAGGYQVTGVIKNIGGSTSFVSTPVVTVLAEDVAGWDVQVTADNTLDALVIKVQGSSGTTIRWVASVRTVEVGR